jgi:hypothetical protein
VLRITGEQTNKQTQDEKKCFFPHVIVSMPKSKKDVVGTPPKK